MTETAAVGSLTQSVPSLATELVTYSRILRFGIHVFALFWAVRSTYCMREREGTLVEGCEL